MIEELNTKIAEVQQKAFAVKANLEVQEKSRAQLEKKCIELGYDPNNLEEAISELKEEETKIIEKLNQLVSQLETLIEKHEEHN